LSERGNQGNGYRIPPLPPAEPVCRPWDRAALQLLQVLQAWCGAVGESGSDWVDRWGEFICFWTEYEGVGGPIRPCFKSNFKNV